MNARLLALSAVSAVALVGTAFADGAEASKSHWSGSVSLTSDYRFRGISQTDRNTALQGEIQYNGSQGLYAGAWASTVDLFDANGSEVDVYAGYEHSLSEETSAGVEIVYYTYPNADISNMNYVELIGKLSHQIGKVGLSIEVAYAPDYLGQSALAYSGGFDAKLLDSVYLFNEGISASGHFGHQSYDGNIDDYNFYDIGISAAAGMFALDVRYTGTDINTADCGSDVCEGGVVVTGTISFGD